MQTATKVMALIGETRETNETGFGETLIHGTGLQQNCIQRLLTKASGHSMRVELDEECGPQPRRRLT